MKHHIIIVVFLCFLSSIAHAERFYEDGYEISVSGQTNSSDTFNVFGRIRGPSCKEADLYVHLEGSKGDRLKIKTKVVNLEPAVTRLIDHSFESDYDKQYWKVKKVSVHCVYNDEPKVYTKKSSKRR